MVFSSAKIYIHPVDAVIDTKFLNVDAGVAVFNTPVLIFSNNKIVIRIYLDKDEFKELLSKLEEIKKQVIGDD